MTAFSDFSQRFLLGKLKGNSLLVCSIIQDFLTACCLCQSFSPSRLSPIRLDQGRKTKYDSPKFSLLIALIAALISCHAFKFKEGFANWYQCVSCLDAKCKPLSVIMHRWDSHGIRHYRQARPSLARYCNSESRGWPPGAAQRLR